ncbi:DsbA family protein [Actinopolymorpha alba]|uniref:DsbA family protein n=1 Tax=Actinopolymorpha alba TaxID=533267 RepID=UPI00037B2F18|nr:thioredoxin domain-containing protein [Actinopolymorpha alba]
MAKKSSGRDALRAERERQAAAQRRRETLLRIGIAVGVGVIIVAIVGVVGWQRSRVDTNAAFPAGVARGAAGASTASPKPPGVGSGIGVGKADAPVVVELFEDFSCPHCREFELEATEMLKQQVDGGRVRVVYYPLTLAQFGRPTQLSANAFACAANDGKAREMHDALYANFSQEWTNDQLVQLGQSLGLTSSSFRSCVRGEKYADWVRSLTITGTDRGVSGTPTVLVNGKELDPDDTSATALQLAIDSALAKSQ